MSQTRVIHKLLLIDYLQLHIAILQLPGRSGAKHEMGGTELKWVEGTSGPPLATAMFSSDSEGARRKIDS